MEKKSTKKRFHNSYEVCNCRQVTLGEIIYAIKEEGAKSLNDLAIITDAGGGCGYCKDKTSDVGEDKKELYLTQILNKFEE